MRKVIGCIAVLEVAYRLVARAYIRRVLGIHVPDDFDKALREWSGHA